MINVILEEVMTPSPVHIDMDAPLVAAESLMEQHQIRHLPVMDDDTLESIVSARDIQRATLPAHAAEREELKVRDVCPVRAFVADVRDPLEKITKVMADKQIGAVIVLNDGELAGIFTETDACRLLSHYLSTAEP